MSMSSYLRGEDFERSETHRVAITFLIIEATKQRERNEIEAKLVIHSYGTGTISVQVNSNDVRAS